MVRVELVRGIVVPMVLQEGTGGEQRLCVTVSRHRRHELQAEVAFHRVVEAPIPNAEVAVVVHLRMRNKQAQIRNRGERKPNPVAVLVSPSPQLPSSNRQSLRTHSVNQLRASRFHRKQDLIKIQNGRAF